MKVELENCTDTKLGEVENSHKGNGSSPFYGICPDNFPVDVLAHCWVDLLTNTYKPPLISIKKSVKISCEGLATLEDLS